MSVIELYEDRSNLALAKESQDPFFSSFAMVMAFAFGFGFVLCCVVLSACVAIAHACEEKPKRPLAPPSNSHRHNTHLCFFEKQAVPHVMQQTYVLRTGVKGISVTRTLRGITQKMFLLQMVGDSILGLSRNFLDPRRY